MEPPYADPHAITSPFLTMSEKLASDVPSGLLNGSPLSLSLDLSHVDGGGGKRVV